MRWAIFRTAKKDAQKDEIDIIIDKIEGFAPKRYFSEREMYYYNYRQLHQYVKPLISLLTYISKGKIKDDNYDEFEENLFLRLKNFYDVNDRLSIEESLKDSSLARKYIELFKIFYNDADMTMSNILECFKRKM